MYHHYHCKKGFTLAEVLITLGIIGIVAALTLPSLIAKHQHKVLETAFKKMYANLYNAVNLVIQEDGPPTMDGKLVEGTVVSEFYNKVFNNLVTAKTISISYYSNNIDLKGYTKKSIKGAIPTQSHSWITNILSDGSAIGGAKNSKGWYFTVDTNGPEKGPNAYGHDIFMFILSSEEKPKLLPVEYEAAHKVDDEGNSYIPDDGLYYEMSNECSKNSSKLSNGYGCTPYALKNICPDDPSKTYWECLP